MTKKPKRTSPEKAVECAFNDGSGVAQQADMGRNNPARGAANDVFAETEQAESDLCKNVFEEQMAEAESSKAQDSAGE